MVYNEIMYEIDDHLAIITLNRPEKSNAFTERMIAEWNHALSTSNANDDVWVIMLIGTGNTFCAGADLSLLEAVGKEEKPYCRTFGCNQISKKA